MSGRFLFDQIYELNFLFTIWFFFISILCNCFLFWNYFLDNFVRYFRHLYRGYILFKILNLWSRCYQLYGFLLFIFLIYLLESLSAYWCLCPRSSHLRIFLDKTTHRTIFAYFFLKFSVYFFNLLSFVFYLLSQWNWLRITIRIYMTTFYFSFSSNRAISI